MQCQIFVEKVPADTQEQTRKTRHAGGNPESDSTAGAGEKTFSLQTFGCQMNVSESDWIRRALLARGWQESIRPRDACVHILNTCSVREKPEQKVYSELGRLRRYITRQPGRFAVVGGCVAQQVGEKFFQRFPFVRLVFGTDQTGRVPETLDALYQTAGRISLLDFESSYTERDFFADTATDNSGATPVAASPSPAPGQAFVNIMKGCDTFCSYCIVPFVRGRQKSRRASDVVAECRLLVSRGIREITLLGQNVNSFGLDASGDGTSFEELLYQVGEITGLERLRFITSHPRDLSQGVIEAFARLEVLCPALHLPVQSGSDSILHAMRRGYTHRQYQEKVASLRRVCPDIALTTDCIVGFPGETEEDFLQTLAVVRQAEFENSFSFVYSDRPGTPAVHMQPRVDRQVALERLQRLQALQQTLTQRAYERQKGTRKRVLVESMSQKQHKQHDQYNNGGSIFWRGRDDAGRVVNFPCPPGFGTMAGKYVTVAITEAKKHSLAGTLVGGPW